MISLFNIFRLMPRTTLFEQFTTEKGENFIYLIIKISERDTTGIIRYGISTILIVSRKYKLREPSSF